MTESKWQVLRNKIYGVAGGVATILFVLGVADATTIEEGQDLLNEILDLAGRGVFLGSSVLAFFKSLPGRTTTVNLPTKRVSVIETTDGKVHIHN